MQSSRKMWQRRKILCFLLIVCFLVACYKAESSTSFFGNQQEEDVCVGDDCHSDKHQGQREQRRESEPVEDDNDGVAAVNVDKVGGDDDVGHQHELQNQTVYGSKKSEHPDEINVIITFTNAKTNSKLQKKFELTLSSLLRHTSVSLALHIIGDPDSQELAEGVLTRIQSDEETKSKHNHRMVKLDVDKLAQDLHKIVKPMQEHFSYKPGAYYSHSLFFLSIAIHQVLPETVHKVIMLDADLKFMDDIAKLYDRFNLFDNESLIGIGHDLQPVYRHAFWKYRQEHRGTRVGEPAPGGLQGFNSGVLLLHLDRMRQSQLYNSLMTVESVTQLTEEYHFKGHLGDQDFFTLVGMKYESLFHVLPCAWNRQLCTWWKDHGYKDVWDLYHSCDMDIKIYHGNCDTPIPY